MDYIGLVHNYWEWRFFPVLSEAIKAVTRLCVPKELREDLPANHCIRISNGVVKEMRGPRLSWMVKKLLKRPVSYAPNAGCGYTVTPLEVWAKKHRRRVWLFIPNVPVEEIPIDLPYGLLDLFNGLFWQIRKRYKFGNQWNGIDGARRWPGNTCQEYVLKCLGRTDGHLFLPEELRHLPELRFYTVFETYREK